MEAAYGHGVLPLLGVAAWAEVAEHRHGGVDASVSTGLDEVRAVGAAAEERHGGQQVRVAWWTKCARRRLGCPR